MKIAHGTADLGELCVAGRGESVKPMLDSLARQRILRPLGGENGHAGDRYEIFHDVLAGAVLAWRTRHEAEAALEEERRRRKRFGWIAAVALVGLLLMASLAAFAWSQREEARKQAASAEKAQQDAENSRKKVANKNSLLVVARDNAKKSEREAQVAADEAIAEKKNADAAKKDATAARIQAQAAAEAAKQGESNAKTERETRVG